MFNSDPVFTCRSGMIRSAGRGLRLALVIGLLLSSGGVSFAQSATDDLDALRAENAVLRERVQALESAIGEIREQLAKPATPAQPATPATPATPAAPAAPAKPSVTAKWPVELYGYFKADASLDSSTTTTGNFVRYVPSEAVRSGDDLFNLTAKQTRFGLRFKGPERGNAVVTGNLELELYANGDVENKPNVGTRHAFMQVAWPKCDVSILGGQTFDVISPLSPSTLNYFVGWNAGNIGFRHPQMRLTKGWAGKETRFELQAAVSRSVGDTTAWTAPGTDTGGDAGPALQGRAAYTFPTGKGRKGTIGVSGHTGKEEYDYNAAGDNQRVDSRSAGIDLSLALGRRFTIKGELWRGENLDDYMGGIAQGIVVRSASGATMLRPVINGAALPAGGVFVDATGIKSRGGWGELTFGPYGKWSFNLGMSREVVDDDIMPDASRIGNRSRWLNAVHDLNDAVQIGVEFSRWTTDYKNARDGNANRVQTSLIYKF